MAKSGLADSVELTQELPSDEDLRRSAAAAATAPAGRATSTSSDSEPSTVSTTATVTQHPPPLVLDEKRLEVINIAGTTDTIVSGDYTYVQTIRGITGYTPVFRNIRSGCILQRNVDNDNTTWKLWHPSHHKGYSFYYAWSSPAKEPYLPPLSGWTEHKSAGGGSLTLTIRIAPMSTDVGSALYAAKTDDLTSDPSPTDDTFDAMAVTHAGVSVGVAAKSVGRTGRPSSTGVTVGTAAAAASAVGAGIAGGTAAAASASVSSAAAASSSVHVSRPSGTVSEKIVGRVSMTSKKTDLKSGSRVSGTGSSGLIGSGVGAAEVKKCVI